MVKWGFQSVRLEECYVIPVSMELKILLWTVWLMLKSVFMTQNLEYLSNSNLALTYNAHFKVFKIPTAGRASSVDNH